MVDTGNRKRMGYLDVERNVPSVSVVNECIGDWL